MLVTLERSGGFTGQRLSSSADTAELGLDGVEEALNALAPAAEAASPGPPGPAASQPRYRLTVHRASGQQVVDLLESQVPAALRPLLAELLRRARADHR